MSGVDLDASNVYDYGRFFIEMTRISSLRGDYYFIEGADSFLELNRKLMLDDFSRFLSRKLQDIEDRMKSLPPILDCDTIKFDRRTNHFVADYYIWFSCNGTLRRIRLGVEYDGACFVISDEIVAERLGAYDSLRNVTGPPPDN